MSAKVASSYAVIGGPRRFRVCSSERVPPRGEEPEEGVWADEIASGSSLFDAVILCVESIEADVIQVRPVSYRAYFEARNRGGERPRPLAVSGYIRDDERILIGRRPNDVTQYAGWTEAVPSGGVEHIAPDGTVDPEAALLAELEEEAGLAKDVRRLGAPLLIQDRGEDMYDMCYPIELSIPIDQALSRAREAGYYRDLECVDLRALAGRTADLVPTTRAIVDYILGCGPFAADPEALR